MQPRSKWATTAAVAALTLVAAGCGSSSKSGSSTTTQPASPAATTTTAPPGPPNVTITATDYAFSGVPATLPAGVQHFTFVNKGSVSHEMAFLKVTSNANTTQIFQGVQKVFNGGVYPTSFIGLNGVHDTQPGHTTVTEFNLTPGQYVALCSDTGVVGSSKDGPPHFTRGMFKRVTVTGTGGTTEPTADVTLTAHDYGFDTSQLKAGTQTVLFKNIGPKQWHFADILEFPKGVTVAQAQTDVTKLLASQGPPPAGVPTSTDLGGSQAASPGSANTFSLTLAKGRTYVVLCFISDRQGGPPHAIAHHMYKIFTVS